MQTFYQIADNYTNAAKTQIKLTIFSQKAFTKQNIYAKIIKVADTDISHIFSENDSFFYVQK